MEFDTNLLLRLFNTEYTLMDYFFQIISVYVLSIKIL